MAHLDFYHSDATEVPMMRKWMLRAIVISLLLHAGLVVFFHLEKVENFGYQESPRLAPPTRLLRSVAIPEISDEDGQRVQPGKMKAVLAIAIPEGKPALQVVQIPLLAPEVNQPIANDEPQTRFGGVDALDYMNSNSLVSLEKQLSNVADGLIEKSARANGEPVVRAQSAPAGEGNLSTTAGIPERQSLDDALADSDPLLVGDRPIAMPGGALYEHDSYDLRPESIDQLRKLGDLIQRNPKATFSIEGHTDSTGTPEYNQWLSEKRAESVKRWLVQFMGIAPESIRTKGFGSSQLIVPADKTVEEQQPNRRVEIVIKANR